jgi:hypothetical protein
MKHLPLRSVGRALLLGTLLSLNGCLLIAAGAGAAGGILGYTYFDNGIDGNFDKPVRSVAEATHQAFKDAGINQTSDMVGDTAFKIEGRSSASDTFVVEGHKSGDNVTTIKITVGTFASKDSQSKAADLYGKIKAHL